MNVAHLLRQSVAVAAYQTANGWGESGFAAPVTRSARVEWADAVAPSGEGEQVTLAATIATLTPIGPKDRVWIPRRGELTVRPEDIADANKARTPSAEGCAPSVGLSGATDFYVTKV